MGNRQLLIDSRFAGVRTNLAPNPSFEATSGVVEVRKNWATHPTVAGVTFVTATGTDLGWSTARGFGVGGTGSHSASGGADDTPVAGITSYGTKAWSAAVTAGNSADTGFQTNPWTGFTAGAVYTVSGWIRSSVARTLVGWTVQWNDATGVIQQATANTGSLTAGLWSRFSIVTTAPPSGATNVVFILDTDGAQAIPNGTTVNVTGLLVEQVGASGTPGRLNYISNPSFERDATNWAASGTSVPTIGRQSGAGAVGVGYLRVTSTGTALYGAVSSGSGIIGVTAGETFAFSAYVRGTVGRQVALRITWSGATASSSGNTAIASASAWQRITYTGTVPAGATGARLDLITQATSTIAGDITEWDAILYERGTNVVGTYFDGTTLGDATTEYAWTGTPFTAPSLIRTGSTAVLDDYFDGLVRPTLRVNLASGPNAVTQTFPGWDEYGWPVNDSQATSTRRTAQVDGPPATGLTSYLRRTWTVNQTNNIETGFNNGSLNVTPGRTYTFSSYLRSSAAGKTDVKMSIVWSTESFVQIGAPIYGDETLLNPGEWARLAVYNVVAPAGAYYADIVSGIDGGTVWLAGDTLDGTGLLIEEGVPLVGSYFDGTTTQPAGRASAWYGTANASPSYVYDTDITVAWLGAANQSASRQTIGAVQYVGASTGTLNTSSTHWSKNRTKSLRQIVTSATTSDTFTLVAASSGGGGGVAGIPLLTPGLTYTVSVTLRQDAATVGTPHTTGSRQIVVTGSAPWTTLRSTQGLNQAGVYEHTLTFVAASTNYGQVRLYHGHSLVSGQADLWWDNLLIEEASAQGVYFDGSFRNATWVGAADGSISRGFAFVGL